MSNPDKKNQNVQVNLILNTLKRICLLDISDRPLSRKDYRNTNKLIATRQREVVSTNKKRKDLEFDVKSSKTPSKCKKGLLNFS